MTLRGIKGGGQRGWPSELTSLDAGYILTLLQPEGMTRQALSRVSGIDELAVYRALVYLETCDFAYYADGAWFRVMLEDLGAP